MNKIFSKRISFIFIIAVISFLTLLGRVLWFETVKGAELTQEANNIRTQEKSLTALRGTIYDTNHNELVVSVQVNTVIVDPNSFRKSISSLANKKIRDKQEKNQKIRLGQYHLYYMDFYKDICDKLSTILEISGEELVSQLDKDSNYYILKRDLNMSNRKQLEELIDKFSLTCFSFEESFKRTYRQGNIAAHVLGFVGNDHYGLSGIEMSFDKELEGVSGLILSEVDADGRRLPQTEYKYIEPTAGNNVVLTIDQTIQYFAEKELDELVEKYDPAKAIILVANPKTGAILAMGNRPTYDPQNWQEYDQIIWDKNPAILYNYEPGSTFKIVSAVAALEENIVSTDENFYCPGYHIVNGIKINCSNVYGHGALTYSKGVATSCNPVYIQVGLRTGKEILYKYIEAFGFGQKTGIELPGEEVGVLIPLEDVTSLDLATMAMGQSLAATPVQVLRAICTVANEGNLANLHLVKQIEDSQGNVLKNYKKASTRKIISTETANLMIDLMEGVILEGTGANAYIEGYSVAGKTGTAEVVGESGGYVEGKYVASFAGIIPADDPQIAILVVVSEPTKGGYYGSQVAAPTFQSLGKNILEYLNVPKEADLPAPLGYTSLNTTQATSNTIEVPNVVGFTSADAVEVLESLGFEVSIAEESGIVKTQSPGAYQFVNKGSLVGITLENPSEEENKIMVPDLKGMTIKKAALILNSLGLNLVSSGSGFATKQEPEFGDKVNLGSDIKVSFEEPKI